MCKSIAYAHIASEVFWSWSQDPALSFESPCLDPHIRLMVRDLGYAATAATLPMKLIVRDLLELECTLDELGSDP